jgi:hypothetical protein
MRFDFLKETDALLELLKNSSMTKKQFAESVSAVTRLTIAHYQRVEEAAEKAVKQNAL